MKKKVRKIALVAKAELTVDLEVVLLQLRSVENGPPAQWCRDSLRRIRSVQFGEELAQGFVDRVATSRPPPRAGGGAAAAAAGAARAGCACPRSAPKVVRAAREARGHAARAGPPRARST